MHIEATVNSRKHKEFLSIIYFGQFIFHTRNCSAIYLSMIILTRVTNFEMTQIHIYEERREV